jgi:hypothetical protein
MSEEQEAQYFDPEVVVRALYGLGRELQGLNVDEPLEALVYALERLNDARRRIHASLAVHGDHGEGEA